MRIITRYIVREHIGPLVFALTALTSLLLLQYVARQLDKLVGKGLPWNVIGEFLVLSLPFTLAMTLPMAVLVSTLHAFGRLSAEAEVTAFKASGVRVRTLMAPVLLIAAFLSLAMVAFNDQVLPRANHRLAILLGDIVSVRPTVGLREQVLTAVTPTFYIKAGWIDPSSNRMREVVIYDLQNTAERRSVYADSGTFTMSPDSVDMQLVLYDGEQLQFPSGDSRRLQRTFFREQVLRVNDFARGFSASSREGKFKSEREQGICELQTEYERRATDYEQRRQRWIAQLRARADESTDSVLRVPKPRPAHGGLARLYCVTIPSLFTPKTAEAAEVPFGQDSFRQDSIRQDSIRRAIAAQDSARRDSLARDSMRRDSLRQDSLVAPAPPTVIMPQPLPGGMPMPTVGPDGLPLPTVGPDGLPLSMQGPGGIQLDAPDMGPAADSINAARARALAASSDSARLGGAMFAVTPESLQIALLEMSKYSVEVQKKFAISMACFVFVLFGPPIALRFPRGGVGVTIGVSLVVFGAYYVCLMAGEVLADRGRLDPVIAMWAANVIFTLAGLVLLLRVEKSSEGSRGGGIRDWWANRKARRALKIRTGATRTSGATA